MRYWMPAFIFLFHFVIESLNFHSKKFLKFWIGFHVLFEFILRCNDAGTESRGGQYSIILPHLLLVQQRNLEKVRIRLQEMVRDRVNTLDIIFSFKPKKNKWFLPS